MNNLQTIFDEYIAYGQSQKRLDPKTINAYRIDLKQFILQLKCTSIENVTPDILENYISYLHKNYKPKTVKRKIGKTLKPYSYSQYPPRLFRKGQSSQPFAR